MLCNCKIWVNQSCQAQLKQPDHQKRFIWKLFLIARNNCAHKATLKGLNKDLFFDDVVWDSVTSSFGPDKTPAPWRVSQFDES